MAAGDRRLPVDLDRVGIRTPPGFSRLLWLFSSSPSMLWIDREFLDLPRCSLSEMTSLSTSEEGQAELFSLSSCYDNCLVL